MPLTKTRSIEFQESEIIAILRADSPKPYQLLIAALQQIVEDIQPATPVSVTLDNDQLSMLTLWAGYGDNDPSGVAFRLAEKFNVFELEEQIKLTDKANNDITWIASISSTNEYSESVTIGDHPNETHRAHIGNVVLDGDAWRTLQLHDKVEAFLRYVVRDKLVTAKDFLFALESNKDVRGKVISNPIKLNQFSMRTFFNKQAWYHKLQSKRSMPAQAALIRRYASVLKCKDHLHKLRRLYSALGFDEFLYKH